MKLRTRRLLPLPRYYARYSGILLSDFASPSFPALPSSPFFTDLHSCRSALLLSLLPSFSLSLLGDFSSCSSVMIFMVASSPSEIRKISPMPCLSSQSSRPSPSQYFQMSFSNSLRLLKRETPRPRFMKVGLRIQRQALDLLKKVLGQVGLQQKLPCDFLCSCCADRYGTYLVRGSRIECTLLPPNFSGRLRLQNLMKPCSARSSSPVVRSMMKVVGMQLKALSLLYSQKEIMFHTRRCLLLISRWNSKWLKQSTSLPSWWYLNPKEFCVHLRKTPQEEGDSARPLRCESARFTASWLFPFPKQQYRVPSPHSFIASIFGPLKYAPSPSSFFIRLLDCRWLNRSSVLICPFGVFERCSEDCFRENFEEFVALWQLCDIVIYITLAIITIRPVTPLIEPFLHTPSAKNLPLPRIQPHGKFLCTRGVGAERRRREGAGSAGIAEMFIIVEWLIINQQTNTRTTIHSKCYNSFKIGGQKDNFSAAQQRPRPQQLPLPSVPPPPSPNLFFTRHIHDQLIINIHKYIGEQMEFFTKNDNSGRSHEEDSREESLFHVGEAEAKTKAFQKIQLGKRLVGRQNCWSRAENYLYVDFLREFFQFFEGSARSREMREIYGLMSEYIKSKNYAQCRIHHFRMLGRWGTSEGVIQATEQRLRGGRGGRKASYRDGLPVCQEEELSAAQQDTKDIWSVISEEAACPRDQETLIDRLI